MGEEEGHEWRVVINGKEAAMASLNNTVLPL
jgi:hypothetical protein